MFNSYGLEKKETRDDRYDVNHFQRQMIDSTSISKNGEVIIDDPVKHKIVKNACSCAIMLRVNARVSIT